MEDTNKDVVNADTIVEGAGSTPSQPEPAVTGDGGTPNDTPDTKAPADTTPKFDENTWKTEKEKYETQLKEYKQKVDIFDMLDKDPEVVKFVQGRFNKAPKQPDQIQITQEEIDESFGDKDKFVKLVEKVADAKYGNLHGEISKANSKVEAMILENDIDTYSKQEGNEDFWKLEEAGLMKPLIREYKDKYPNASYLAVIQEAHKQARSIVDTIKSQADSKAKDMARGIVNAKKNASIDKGTGGTPALNVKDKSLIDIGKEVAKNLNMDW